MFPDVLDHNPSAQLSVALFGCRAAVLRLVHHGDEVVVEHSVGLHGSGGVAVEEDSAEMELLDLGHKFGTRASTT
jgi:hypothetical protein